MTPSRLLKRLIIAEALVQGSSIAAVARHLGASRSWVSREANAPETRPLFSALLERHAESIAQRINNAFTTLDNAMEASKLVRSKTRAWEVPDHRRRLEAVALFIRLMKVLPGPRVPPPTCPRSGSTVDLRLKSSRELQSDLA